MQTGLWATHNARDQLLALAMASHPRCGAHSPARGFMSLPPLATSPLWEWCLSDTAVWFGLFTEMPFPTESVYNRFALSSALNSPISSTHKATNCGSSSTFHGALSVNRVVLGRANDPELLPSRVFTLDSAASGFENTLWWSRAITLITVNEKWVVECSRNGRDLRLLNMAQNPPLRIGGNDPGVKVRLVWPGYLADTFNVACRGALLNKSCLDEAVVVSENEDSLFLMVIDLGKTYTTKEPVVLHLVTWKHPEGVSFFGSGIAMTKSTTGQCVVYVEMRSLGSGTVLEFLVDGTATPKPISDLANQVSQLSSSLFCISKAGPSLEIWDCNNTSSPLRVMEARAGAYAPLIAESGFLFCRRESSNGIEVTDSHCNLVCTIVLPSHPIQSTESNKCIASLSGKIVGVAVPVPSAQLNMLYLLDPSALTMKVCYPYYNLTVNRLSHVNIQWELDHSTKPFILTTKQVP
ncbi:hypothetical protein Pelo_15784 [Pelomyxa schiedti]|nr:hypothetical protein Pelo_15784 [Pelomyxa schiedti]